MRILVIGSGGREHALALFLSQSPLCSQIFVAPGNGGTAAFAGSLSINLSDFQSVIKTIKENEIGLVVVGPEAPLVDGLADALREAEIPVVGPGKIGAQLEGSKAFAKAFLQRHGIPTAAYRAFMKGELDSALEYIKTQKYPLVVKADGLAAGKGVVIAQNEAEAAETLADFLNGSAFGSAGETVVVEQFLAGEELSVFVLTDGKTYCLLPSAKDHKRIGEGDTGLNTGGMGAISPAPYASPEFLARVENEVVKPTLAGLQADGIDFQGFLFIGLMKTDGIPYVLEYNVRLGDPETQTILPLIESDLAELLLAAATGKLAEADVRVSAKTSATVVCASGGYPGAFETGYPITLPEVPANVTIFHAGTKLSDGRLVTSGGRVLAINAVADTLAEAREAALAAAIAVEYQGKYYRRDIGA